MKEKTKKLIKTAKILAKVGKILATTATVAMAVYTLIPKYEKIEGVNADVLVSGKEVA